MHFLHPVLFFFIHWHKIRFDISWYHSWIRYKWIQMLFCENHSLELLSLLESAWSYAFFFTACDEIYFVFLYCRKVIKPPVDEVHVNELYLIFLSFKIICVSTFSLVTCFFLHLLCFMLECFCYFLIYLVPENVNGLIFSYNGRM